MATVDGLTAARMQTFIDASVVSGAIDGTGHLILTTQGGSDMDAGYVKGDVGDTGAPGDTGSTGATGPTGPSGAVTGMVVMWSTGSPPAGWLICDGAAVSRASFAALFAVIGTSFGAGDGSTTFNTPNLTQRFVRQDTSALAGSGGAATHDHDLDGGTPPGHAQMAITTGAGPNIQIRRNSSVASWVSNFQATTGSSNTSTDSANKPYGAYLAGHTDSASSLPPYLNLNHIIKT